ncbi:MAG TPA: nucleotidyltransferase family protein, partial [Blastocatellia bacterium]|nr:nucleotidyltransferase family protein [Blastocatellia bacterium]
MISAILLAAGESRRMGQFKQLLRLGDKSFVEHCVDNLLASRVNEVIIVTGHREFEIRREVGDRPVRFAQNPDYRSGMASSIKCGVRSVSEEARALVLALVDQPQISSSVIDLVVEAYEREPAPIVVPVYEGKTGHPILLDLTLKEEILSFDPEQGLRQVVRAHRDQILRVEV